MQYTLAVLLYSLMLASASASTIIANPTSIIDNGSFITDTVNHRDWLKFNSTLGMSFDAAVSQFAFGGWLPATGTQIQGLESQFGWQGDTPCNCSDVNANAGLTAAMANLFGYTSSGDGFGSSSRGFIIATTADVKSPGDNWMSISDVDTVNNRLNDYVSIQMRDRDHLTSDAVPDQAIWLTRPTGFLASWGSVLAGAAGTTITHNSGASAPAVKGIDNLFFGDRLDSSIAGLQTEAENGVRIQVAAPGTSFVLQDYNLVNHPVATLLTGQIDVLKTNGLLFIATGAGQVSGDLDLALTVSTLGTIETDSLAVREGIAFYQDITGTKTEIDAGSSLVVLTDLSLDTVVSSTLATVPEPATLALLGIGLAGLGFSRRKRTAN